MLKIFLFQSLIFYTVLNQNINVNYTDYNQQSIAVFWGQNSSYNPQFVKPTTSQESCQNPDMFFMNISSNNPNNTIEIFNILDKPLTILTPITFKSEGNYKFNTSWCNLCPLDIPSQESAKLVFTVECPSKLTDENYWSYMNVGITFDDPSQNINFRYIIICDVNHRTKRFDYSLLILIGVSAIMVYFFSRFQQIRGFDTNFVGFRFSWYFCFIYIGIGGGALGASYVSPVAVFQIAMVSVIPLAMLSIYFFSCELLALLPKKLKLVSKIFKIVRIQDIIALSLVCILITAYFLTNQSWYITDLIGVFMIGTFMKIVKFENMKNATIFLLLCTIADVIGAVIIHYTQSLSYDYSIISYYDSPFEIQIPCFKHLLFKQCSWLPITGVIFPGLFIAYMVRVDKSDIRHNNSYVFQVLSYFGYFLGSGFWVMTTIFNNHAWPFSLFSYPLMILLTSVFAYKRGEITLLWQGEFFDPELYENIMKQEFKEQALTENFQKNVSQEQDENLKNKIFKGLGVMENQKRINNLSQNFNEFKQPSSSAQSVYQINKHNTDQDYSIITENDDSYIYNNEENQQKNKVNNLVRQQSLQLGANQLDSQYQQQQTQLRHSNFHSSKEANVYYENLKEIKEEICESYISQTLKK